MDVTKTNWTKRTLAAQAMGKIDAGTMGIVPPIHVTTTFIRDDDNQYRTGNIYGRPDNATIREAESIIAMLESAPEALVFGSGMASAVACFLALAPGDHVIAPNVMYWALRNWLMTEGRHWGLSIDFVDMSDAKAVQAAVTAKTKLIWAETPANPLWSITDIAAVAAIARKAGARLAVDSTCATPILSQPLALGADIVMHAATKYLNGHSDVLAGALACRTPDAYWERIRMVRKNVGAILGPFEAFLLIRGMRTLDLRVRAASANAMQLAEAFARHPQVTEVLYPGLPDSPGHAVAARQMNGGFGGMLSIRVQGGEAGAIRTAKEVQLWKRATSLGGVESLIEHRASIEGAGSPCPPDLLRLSAGIESAEDLFDDLDQALKRAHN
ncbi:MAG: aminotransferase class I/II-fold pyridoxal phosphate-dependent enzyme [Methylocystis sp.]|nr:aminotransferase class I/II-fold pyridoxal phosphate-dependent enzyme [Methylocystis sp.]MCA3583897.1 aminotransferase class I/II-fold pyridoxal phosphate-dependent enzyme [Methylocystis sp.]MCA3588448.1 aminotransferase class I/II-fold pyridoxal phosphate-dependent enzyme [Methylocystis sp.]MCA3592401.1 aminotransferase class I/II-fold pyridoxal phosphate-dependent enzyme [Methylocystis sp.]